MNYSNYLFTIDITWGDRWQVHRRLQELEIPCECSTGQLLVVTVDTPTAAIQVWSVTRTQSLGFALPSLVSERLHHRDATRTAIGRSQLVNWLDRCFALQAVGAATVCKQTPGVGDACVLPLRNEHHNDSELPHD